MSSRKLEIKYADLWGLREKKYKWLERHDVANTKWQKFSPVEPFYFFIPRSREGWGSYQSFWKVTDIFPVNGVGITTARDHFVIDLNKGTLFTQVRKFKNSRYPDDRLHKFFNIREKRGWSIRKAWNVIQPFSDSDLESLIVPVLYRPFDTRWIFYHDSLVWRTVKRVMQHMLQPNLALLAKRQSKLDFSYAFITDKIAESCVFESAYANNTVFPLYLYTETQTAEKKKSPGSSVMMLFDKPSGGYKVRKPNINPELHALLNNTFNPQPVTTLGKQKPFDVSPEEIFYYIYAVLYSNTYRQKYQEFLKIDFPRIPFTKNYQLFQKLAQFGKELTELHLLKSPDLRNPTAKFQGKNNNVVEKREYQKGRVYINDEQYFEGIKPEVWNYHIGGYQVLDKWLKDRRGRSLSSEDIKHYCRVATALEKTVGLQKKIDNLYPEVEKELQPKSPPNP